MFWIPIRIQSFLNLLASLTLILTVPFSKVLKFFKISSTFYIIKWYFCAWSQKCPGRNRIRPDPWLIGLLDPTPHPYFNITYSRIDLITNSQHCFLLDFSVLAYFIVHLEKILSSASSWFRRGPSRSPWTICRSGPSWSRAGFRSRASYYRS